MLFASMHSTMSDEAKYRVSVCSESPKHFDILFTRMIKPGE